MVNKRSKNHTKLKIIKCNLQKMLSNWDDWNKLFTYMDVNYNDNHQIFERFSLFLFINLALSISTFYEIIQGDTMNRQQVNFYGIVNWSLFIHLVGPFVCLYRVHSTVCLLDLLQLAFWFDMIWFHCSYISNYREWDAPFYCCYL